MDILGMRVNGCCGKSLRVAGLLIGWLNILFAVISIGSITKLIIFNDANETPQYSIDISHGITKTLNGKIILLLFYLFDAVITGLLLTGIYKNKHNIILPWLVLRALGIIVTIPIVIFALLSSPFSNAAEISGTIAAGLISALTLYLFLWCWIVIHSLYHEIRKSVGRQLTSSYTY